MELKTNLANSKNYGNKRASASIKWIVIHYTANDGDTDEANANYFKGERGASAHRFVDDDSITISVPDDYVAWSVGGSKYSNCNVTGGGKYYNQCTNANSLSLELCDCVKNGKSDFTEATLKNAVWQVKEWMKQYNIDINHVIRHFDVTGKPCPKPYVDDENQWRAFKTRLVENCPAKDNDLVQAVLKLNKDGIISNPEKWNDVSNMDMAHAETLIQKLALSMIDYKDCINILKAHGIISDEELWLAKKYDAPHMRSLIIKSANK